jgi:hypothetical protein
VRAFGARGWGRITARSDPPVTPNGPRTLGNRDPHAIRSARSDALGVRTIVPRSVLAFVLGLEAGAQEVQHLDGLRAVGVDLLLDDVPSVADAERRGPHAQAPGKVEPATDFSDGGVNELEVVRPAEPRAESLGNCFGPSQSIGPGGSIARNRTVESSVVAIPA